MFPCVLSTVCSFISMETLVYLKRVVDPFLLIFDIII